MMHRLPFRVCLFVAAAGLLALLAMVFAAAPAEAQPTTIQSTSTLIQPTSTPLPDAGQYHRDPVNDVYDYFLKSPATSSGASQADLVWINVLIAGMILFPDGHPSLTDTLPWYVAGSGVVCEDPGAIARVPFAWGTTCQGTGSATFYYRYGPGLWIDGARWAIQFQAQESRVRIDSDETFTAAFWDSLTVKFPNTQVDYSGESVEFSGMTSVIQYDAGTQTLDAYLLEGTLMADQTYQKTGDTLAEALHVRIAPDGTSTADTVSVVDALALMSGRARSILVQVTMAEAVAPSKSEAEQEWVALFDLDGDPSTGFYQEGDQQMFTGLGVDLYVRVDLADDGSLVASGDLLARTVRDGQIVTVQVGQLPVQATLNSDRTTIGIWIPLLYLYPILRPLQDPVTGEPLGLRVAPETIHWRVSSTNYSSEEDAKDVFPEVDFVYPSPMAVPE